jgi:uncharacterized protein with GYD domain
MATFFMFGKYSFEAIKKISGERTEEAIGLVEKFGGHVNSIYALLGEHDLVIIVNFPDVEQVMKTAIALNKMTGISFSTTPAVSVEEFDKIMAEV